MHYLEKKAINLLKKQGYKVEKYPKVKYQRQDFLGLFDIMAIKPTHIRFIQVSKIEFNKRSRKFKEKWFKTELPKCCTKEYWVWSKEIKGFMIDYPILGQ